jgi:hypothetical protein
MRKCHAAKNKGARLEALTASYSSAESPVERKARFSMFSNRGFDTVREWYLRLQRK